MSARQELLNALYAGDVWDTPGVPERLIDAFAHELAEQQRDAIPDVMDRWSGELHQDTISEVIDLIDPQQSVGPVRPGDEPAV